MSKVVVINNLTLDGVMQAPGRPDEDLRGGFEHGGWALPYNDAVMGQVMGQGMHPGDMLVVHSDGLVETGDQTLDLRAFAGEMEQATGAGELVQRLVYQASKGQSDDVTVVVLRRLQDHALQLDRQKVETIA
jgi:hypothetical protein